MSIDNPETTFEHAIHRGYQRGLDEGDEVGFKRGVNVAIDMVRGCLDRQPDLQKIVAALEELV